MLGTKFGARLGAKRVIRWGVSAACSVALVAGLTAPALAAAYTVRQGDTYWALSRRFGVSVQSLEAANPNHPALQLYPGAVLQVPGAGSAPSAGAAPSVGQTRGGQVTVGAASVDILARLAVAEEGNRSYQDQLGVAAVVMNRLHHGGFGKTVRQIVFGGNQFTSVANGSYWNTSATATSLRAARAAASGADPTGGALYFYDPGPDVSSAWIYRQPVTRVIDGTVYAR